MPLKAFLVEDNLSIRESLAEALAELADVTMCGVASDEKTAAAWLTNPSHDWDVAIVDLVLEAGGNGFGVLRACEGRPAGRQVLVLTATANPAVRRQCEALGSDGVFDKSMETEALIEWCATKSREKEHR